MKIGLKRVLWTLAVGAGVGAFGGLMVILIVPPTDPGLYLGALMVGAALGLCAAVWVILRYRGLPDSE